MTDSQGLPEIDVPGTSELREAVANAGWPTFPRPRNLRADAIAGLNSTLSSVPDGMASGVLAGVNPIYGLYACSVGPIAGGIFSSSKLMLVTTTSAASIGAGQALVATPREDRAEALFLMVILVGLFQVAAGLLKLGRLTRFVSFSVMTGFIAGIAVLTIMTQLPAATAYEPEGDTRVSQTIDLLLHPGEFHLLSLGIALSSLALAVLLRRTIVGNLSSLLAIIGPSVAIFVAGTDSVQTVRDVGDIPSGIPLPALPSLSMLSGEIVTGAAAVAAIILVQGAGVSQGAPNPDGSRQSMSRDFIAQGAANVASGFFRGLPVGGSLSTTALSVLAGAQTRWAAIFAGLFMALIVIAFSGAVARIAMPSLAALLIIASASTIKVARLTSVWNTSWESRVAAVATFVATLFLPIQAAVGIGVALSAVIMLYESSNDISLVQMVRRPDGQIEERPPVKELESGQITVLDVYGHLFYAGARHLGRLLPSPNRAEHPVVILRLRGRTAVGATLVDELSEYARRLEARGGRLFLSGINANVRQQLADTAKLDLAGPVQVYEATPILGESTGQAYADAETWLVQMGVRASDSAPPQTNGADDERVSYPVALLRHLRELARRLLKRLRKHGEDDREE